MHKPSDRSLYRRLSALMLPIVLQNLLSAIVNSADVFMLSSVSQSALSASSLAAQVTFVLMLFHWGICAGTTMMASQYFGRGNDRVIRQVQGFAMSLMAAVAGAFFFACLLMPQTLMRLFTADPELIDLGGAFLRVLGVSYLPMSASQVLLAVMKSIGQTRLSAMISTGCLIVKIALNFLCIFVLFPGDVRMAMLGVAGATVAARVIELLLCAAVIRAGKSVPFSLADCRAVPRWLMRDFAKYTAPVQANHLIAGVALTTLTAIMGRLGSDVVSANAIAVNIRDLVTVASMALGTAGGILLGQEMGAGRLERAKALGGTLEKLALALGVASGLLLFALRPVIMRFCALEGSAASLLYMMIPVCALYCVGRSYNACLISGIFVAGGDTRFGVILDTITMWVIVVPLSMLAAFVFKWPPLIIYLFLNLDEFVKMIPSAIWLRRWHWLRNLTRDV